MNNDELRYRIAFASIRGMGVNLARQLLEVVGNERAFFDMNEKELRQLTHGQSKIYTNYYRQQQLERADRELDFIAQNHITTTYFTDSTYPRRLLEAEDAPCMLYSRGTCDLNGAHLVGIVGTRHATQYGLSFCDTFIRDLAAALPDTVVVSGLAYGIDIAAHRACLKHGLSTVAVMARGLNGIYPAMHRNDAVKIVRNNGMVLTDYLSSDEIHRGNFLARNRIIAALSDCTVIVESADHGGSLVTASLAQSYNREVMAVPGRVGDEFSRGCNRIIRTNQAMSISCADDMIEALNWDLERKTRQAQQMEVFPSLNDEEQAIVDVLKQQGDVHINTIASELKLPIYRLMSTLVELDCRGIIITLPGCRYCMR
ncbi:MAG: DNA-processing protein DprA [Muribaculaceae bacterium]|nr:DNA-processing protein DprA [Muribaculaceae bacterium]